MNEITTIILENEMDLILANKQSMRLAELAGLSVSGQTTFGTAVSEVARTAIDRTANATLSLSVSATADRSRYIAAIIRNAPGKITGRQQEGYAYAKRLVSNIQVTNNDSETIIELRCQLPDSARINDAFIEKARIMLNTDPAVSPYEEIKRKNRQLVELSNKLAASEHRYRDLTDSLPLLIFTLDPKGKIIYANKWLTDYTGKSIEELNETGWGDTLPPGEQQEAWDDFFTSATHKKPLPRQRLLRNAHDGTYRWHSGIATPVFNDNDEVVTWNIFMADIHAQKMVEETLKDNKELKETQAQLEEKVEELARSNSELEQFAYVASHDLQEPLRKISFFSDMLRNKYKEELPAEAHGYFENIMRSTDRMKMLIHDVLAYSTIDAEDKMAPTDLAQVAGEALADLEMVIRQKSAKVTVGRLPTVTGNSVQLKQLMVNLMSNSLKFVQPDVEPRINLAATEKDDNIVLSFSDNGIGFDTVYLDKMFHLFQRLHSRDKYIGTGIGLAICKKIVHAHGGTIHATSTPGEGSTFIVSLPKHTSN